LSGTQDDGITNMILPILTYPNPLLKKKAIKIKDPKDSEIKELIFDMLETLGEANGLGLAAPQVGKSVRLCIIKLDGKTYILVNPKIKSRSWKKETLEEGCLSFPGQFMPIKRSWKVKVEAQDKNGEKIKIEAEGLLARAFQHEIDHLDGIVFIDRK
jgi:peptide deformylase